MSDFVSVPRELVEFLRGSAPLEGVWFGEKHPTRKGAYWWRSAYLDAAPPVEAQPVAWRYRITMKGKESGAWQYASGAKSPSVPLPEAPARGSVEAEPLYTHPTADVNQQLLEALEKLLDLYLMRTDPFGPGNLRGKHGLFTDSEYGRWARDTLKTARAALQAAIAALPKEGPVAQVVTIAQGRNSGKQVQMFVDLPNGTKLYTHPQPDPAKLAAWQAEVMELADEYADARWAVGYAQTGRISTASVDARAALEAKIKERP